MMFPICIFANEHSEKITNNSELNQDVLRLKKDIDKAKKDGNFTREEKTAIIVNTEPNVIKEYANFVIVEAINEIEGKEITLDVNEVALKERVELDTGGYVEFEAYDVAEGESIEPLAASLKTTDHVVVRELYKEYGNRYFTANYTTGFLRGWLKLTVVHKYSIGDYGLKVRSAVCDVDYSYSSLGGSFSIRSYTFTVTDSVATANGSDINVEGKLKFDLTGLASKGPHTKILDTRVKLVNLDKTNDRAKVKEHFYVKKDFF